MESNFFIVLDTTKFCLDFRMCEGSGSLRLLLPRVGRTWNLLIEHKVINLSFSALC